MRPLAFTIMGAAITAAACTGSGYEPQAEDNAPARVTGMLFVERVEGGSVPGVQVGARFLRITGVADSALPDLVGTPAMPRVGACVEHGTPSDTTTPDPLRAQVRLLDVGPIQVHIAGRQLEMQPRRFPDLWNVVSGVLYGAEADLPMGTWRFSAQGATGSGVGGFDVSSQAPTPLMGVSVGGAPLPLGAGIVMPLQRRGPLPIRWHRGGDDLIAIEFEGNGSMVCGARDEGAFDLDAATNDRAREILRNGGTVSVHRMRSRPFSSQGLDAATLVFDLSVRGRVRVE